METRHKIRELLEAMDGTQRQFVAEELKAMNVAQRPRVAMEEITPARLMQDKDFAARVRAEIDSALRGEI